MERFDLIVIGTGTRLNRGCIPSKMLVHVADVARTITDAKHFGIHTTPTSRRHGRGQW